MKAIPHITVSKTDEEKLWKTGGGEGQREIKPEVKLGEICECFSVLEEVERKLLTKKKQEQQAEMGRDEY